MAFGTGGYITLDSTSAFASPTIHGSEYRPLDTLSLHSCH